MLVDFNIDLDELLRGLGKSPEKVDKATYNRRKTGTAARKNAWREKNPEKVQATYERNLQTRRDRYATDTEYRARRLELVKASYRRNREHYLAYAAEQRARAKARKIENETPAS